MITHIPCRMCGKMINITWERPCEKCKWLEKELKTDSSGKTYRETIRRYSDDMVCYKKTKELIDQMDRRNALKFLAVAPLFPAFPEDNNNDVPVEVQDKIKHVSFKFPLEKFDNAGFNHITVTRESGQTEKYQLERKVFWKLLDTLKFEGKMPMDQVIEIVLKHGKRVKE